MAGKTIILWDIIVFVILLRQLYLCCPRASWPKVQCSAQKVWVGRWVGTDRMVKGGGEAEEVEGKKEGKGARAEGRETWESGAGGGMRKRGGGGGAEK